MSLALVLALVPLAGHVPAAAAPAALAPVAAPTAPAAVAAPRSEVGQFSDPVWFPLRRPAGVHCVRTNCPGPYHGHWAIDLLGEMGDPIFAAGAGRAYIGAISPECSLTNPRAGTWIWIDHGGGIVSRYFHLDDVRITNGQWVTPATRIGSMGRSGAKAPCLEGAYLHFEIRRGSLSGSTTYIPPMTACSGGESISYPSALGYEEWDDIPVTPRLTTGTHDSSCVPSTFISPAPPQPTVSIGDGTLDVSTDATGQGVNGLALLVEVWRPSANRFAPLGYRYENGSQMVSSWTGLLNGREHRVQVAARNSNGWGPWSSPTVVVPGRAPDPPRVPRSLTWSRSRISLGWYRSVRAGFEITGYDVAISRRTRYSWTPWTAITVPNQSSHKFLGLQAGTTYRFRVRALSEAGPSGWSSVVRATTDSAPRTRTVPHPS